MTYTTFTRTADTAGQITFMAITESHEINVESSGRIKRAKCVVQQGIELSW